MNVAVYPTDRELNVISICTGGGGLDLGLELAIPTARAAMYLEREAFAVAHLVEAMRQGLMAEAPIWSDVRTFAGRPWRGLVDSLIGGIPCQPHSLAGSRLGEDDDRDLWSDARRIIVQCRPWFVVIENVEGMLTSGGAERVVRNLRRLGYAVEIGLFSASETGASHQRNRVFIVAVADATDPRRGNAQNSGTDCSSERAGSRAPRRRQTGICEPQRGADRMADTGCDGVERRRGTGDFPGAQGEAEGTRYQRQRHGRAAGDLREDLDDANEPGLAIDRGERHDARSQFAPAKRSRRSVDDATGSDGSVYSGQRQSGESTADAGRPSDLGLYPPGPADLDGWRRVLAHSPHLEPAVRRMADGVAARLDLSGPHAARIERLRLLGNGVVPLQAAFAIRTLCARLAGTGSPYAAQLVRMMEMI